MKPLTPADLIASDHGKRKWALFGVLIWGAMLATAMGAISVYQMRPGIQLEAPNRLGGVIGKSLTPHLFLFMHPQCPCSVASLSELERLQAETAGKLQITIVFVEPSQKSSWQQTSLEDRARASKSWEVVSDPGGRLAQSMGAVTSGFVVLFDRNGKKVFQGGITVSRGHEGDNIGHDAIAQFALTGTVPVSHTEVFGCSLGDLGARQGL